MDIQFYHLLSTPLERALPKIMEKALAGGFRVVVKTADDVTADKLNDALWTYDPAKFLPHGSFRDGDADRQPIYISPNAENPNQGNVLVVTDGSALQEGFARVLDMFDGRDETQVLSARERWKHYKESGHAISYIKQQPDGGWKKET